MSKYPELDLILNLLNLEDILESEDVNLKKKYVSPMKLRQIYRYMCKARELLLQIRKHRNNSHMFDEAITLGRFFTRFLLERCYWIRYGDSAMVSDLLKTLFELDGHLGRIFDYQQLCVKPERKIFNSSGSPYETTWTAETLSYEEVQPFSYFMEHANKMKTLFVNQRLAETCLAHNMFTDNSLILPPCSKTFIFPEILIQLLKYGLFAKSKPDEDEIGKLLTGIIGVILNSNTSNSAHKDDYVSRIIKVGNVLLRAVPHVKISSLLQGQKLTNKMEMTRCIVQQMSAPKILPTLILRCAGPQELQHLCRRSIRQALYDNWMLPHGTIMLPLPPLMKEYINLEIDFLIK